MGDDAYKAMDELASTSPIGAGGVLFNPSLAGGTSQDKSIHIRGAFLGLNLGTRRADLIRATLEGVALNLKSSCDLLKKKVPLTDHLLFCGGGSKSRLWMQIFADVFNMYIVKTNIDQDAASLGAAAICARAVGKINDYSVISSLHHIQNVSEPNPDAVEKYAQIYRNFVTASDMLSDFGDAVNKTR